MAGNQDEPCNSYQGMVGVVTPKIYTGLSSEVQLGQRLALIGIEVAQRGQSFVVGVAGTAAFFGPCIRAIGRTIRKNTAAAIIKKLIMVFMNTP